MNRRGFLGRGAAFGVLGGLLAVAVGGDRADAAAPVVASAPPAPPLNMLPSELAPLPDLPEPSIVDVAPMFTGTAVSRPSYDWSDPKETTVDLTRELYLRYSINGRVYVVPAWVDTTPERP